MDALTLIISALAAGAGAGLSDTTATAVGTALNRLKSQLTAHFAGDGDGDAVLAVAGYESDPERWQPVLTRALHASPARTDPEVLATARDVLGTIRSTTTYTYNLTNSQGSVIGNGNTQTNHFGPS
ncbi:hypothetical protein [Actinocorallia longicatena]|uniref:RHIM domain-containing protein n=1 Tax=Actinocorallia longicatena TaxID=111803 RepID=A0ABP6Q774_9ACTN